MITDILKPASAREALRAKSVPGSAYLGGGTWLNSGRAEGVTTLISLEKLGLDFVRASGGACTVGASATLQAVVDAQAAPQALRQAARLTASRTLRNMRTVGGELGSNAADSAIIPVLMAMGATVEVAGRRRPFPIEEFLDRPRGDLVLSISIPAADRRGTVRVLSRTSHSPRSLVVAACLAVTHSGERQVRMVISDCAGKRARLVQATPAAAEPQAHGRLQELVSRVFAPAPDIHASVPYKKYMAGVLAVEAAAEVAAQAVAS